MGNDEMLGAMIKDLVRDDFDLDCGGKNGYKHFKAIRLTPDSYRLVVEKMDGTVDAGTVDLAEAIQRLIEVAN